MVNTYFGNIFSKIEAQHPNEPEIYAAAKDIIFSLTPLFEQNKQLIYQGILETLVEQGRLSDLISPKGNSYFSTASSSASHGLVYFVHEMLEDKHIDMIGKTAIVAGSNLQAIHTMNKLNELGVSILACSDDKGVIHDPYGIDIPLIDTLANTQNLSIEHYLLSHPEARYIKNSLALWCIPCQIAITCTTTPPLNLESAKQLVLGGCLALAGGNSLSIPGEVVSYLLRHQVLYSPEKVTQLADSTGIDTGNLSELQLKSLMKDAYMTCKMAATKYGCKDQLSVGANITNFEWASKADLSYC